MWLEGGRYVERDAREQSLAVVGELMSTSVVLFRGVFCGGVIGGVTRYGDAGSAGSMSMSM